MTFWRTHILSLCLTLAVSVTTMADSRASGPSALLEPFRQLAGAWDADIDGDGKAESEVNYRVIANGSAVTETLFPGTPHEMVSVYFVDGERLMCTHYCAAGNQPRMAAAPLAEGTIAFTMVDATNLADPNELHMNSVAFKFVDATHVTADWGSAENGKDAHHAIFRMTRRVVSGDQSREQPNATPQARPAPEALSDFIILMYEDDGAWEKLPKDRQDALMKLYVAWVADLQKRDLFRFGAACGATQVLLRGAGATVTSEAHAPTKDVLNGFFVIRASSLDSAVSLAKTCPALTHGERIVVRAATHE